MKIVYQKDNQKPRGYAFIEFEHERDMHGKSSTQRTLQSTSRMSGDITDLYCCCCELAANSPLDVIETLCSVLRSVCIAILVLLLAVVSSVHVSVHFKCSCLFLYVRLHEFVVEGLVEPLPLI